MMSFSLLEQVFPKFETSYIPLKKLGVASRVFINWKEKGLIDYQHKFTPDDQLNHVKRKNIKLNLFDALWVLIIKELRSLKIDLKTIKEVRSFLHTSIDLSSINDTEFEELRKSNELFQTDDLKEKAEVDKFFQSKETFISNYNKAKIYKPNFSNHLGSVISQILLLGQSPFITLLKKPNSKTMIVDLYNPDIINFYGKSTNRNFSEEFVRGLTQSSMVSIPIKPLFELFFEDKHLLPYAKSFELFNEKELTILRIIKDEDFTKIIIHKNADNIVTIEHNQRTEIKGHQVDELRKSLGLKTYDKIELINRNDKHIIVNNISKHKIDLGKP